MLSRYGFALALLLATAPAGAQGGWNDPFPPHRIADNLYYVGSNELASFLITTSAGHIIINSGFEETVPLIRKNVERLGFKLGDVKILLISHAHNDHVEGMALLRELTGAAVYVMRGDDKVISRGGAGRACPVARVLQDGDKVTLGRVTLTARLTAGHTRGCTTWTMRVQDHGESRLAVIVGSPNVLPSYRLVGNTDYPEIAADYARGFALLKSLPCDIFLGSHASFYDMVEKHGRLAAGGTNPFVDREGYRAYVAEREQAFLARLEEQTRNAGAREAASRR